MSKTLQERARAIVDGCRYEVEQAVEDEIRAMADRIDELEELLRLVHVDVVRATGVLVDLDDRIAAALKEKP
jgi:hypothetical protein